jgi:acyl carrier protein
MSETSVLDIVRRTMGELLETKEIGDDVNFMSAGGDSLKAIRLAWRISEATGLDVNVASDIMPNPTPKGVAERLIARQT